MKIQISLQLFLISFSTIFLSMFVISVSGQYHSPQSGFAKLTNLAHDKVAPNLNILIENLTELRELYLNGLNISAHGHDWCQAKLSSLPNLRVLSLPHCNLFGPLDSSLMKLQNLSVIHLDLNTFSSTQLYLLDLSENKFDGPRPKFFFKLHGPNTLSLSSNNFSGSIELRMFGNLGNLSSLDISGNKFTNNCKMITSMLNPAQFI